VRLPHFVLGAAAIVVLATGVMVIHVSRTGGEAAGVSGKVKVGCPRPALCLLLPVPATQLVYRRANGKLEPVGRFRSSWDGSFQMKLPAGRYVIASSPGQRWGSMRPAEVVVRDATMTDVTLVYKHRPG